MSLISLSNSQNIFKQCFIKRHTEIVYPVSNVKKRKTKYSVLSKYVLFGGCCTSNEKPHSYLMHYMHILYNLLFYWVPSSKSKIAKDNIKKVKPTFA